MREVAVGYLWHMHQPYCKDPLAGTFLLTWVRQHSVRAYYDMIPLPEENREISCTFNIEGHVSHFLEWLKAGCYVRPGTSASMYRRKPFMARLLYGFDREYLFVRMGISAMPRSGAVFMHVVSPQEYFLHIPLQGETVIIYGFAGGVRQKKAQRESVARRSILEMRAPFFLLDAGPSLRMRFL